MKEKNFFQLQRSEKGFTLIELAIVLVIIGIILGAVMKGQDLIESARIKKLTTTARQWETIAWQFYDRLGYFPGASASNSLITGNPNTDITTTGKFTDAPTTNSIALGANTFYVLFGSDGTRNLMAICVDSGCGTAFTDPQLAYAQSFDTTIDGSASGTSGRVFAGTAITGTNAGNWLAGTGGITSAAWATTAKAIIYYFDKKP